MPFKDSYFIIQKSEQTIYKDKNSKFLAFAFYVEDETQIKQHLSELKRNIPQLIIIVTPGN